jgi:hypothetical protein
LQHIVKIKLRIPACLQMSVANLLETDNKRTFESAKNIEITKNTLKFGSSVYQFKNVTGFRVGEIPKEKFPILPVLVLTSVGTLTIALGFGLVLIIIAIIMSVVYFTQTQYYGLSIYLNSGRELFFKSENRNFLLKIVSDMYEFMESQADGSVLIDMSSSTTHLDNSNRSINVKGDLHGKASTGDQSSIF